MYSNFIFSTPLSSSNTEKTPSKMKALPPLVIDNGSYEIKFGLANQGQKPYHCYNCVAKNTNLGTESFYIGNQLDSKLQNSTSGVYIKRPIERGQLTSWEIENEVWNYCFYNPEEFGGFELSNNTNERQDLILSETIFTLPELSRNTDQIVFEEYAFDSLYKAPSASFVPFNKESILRNMLLNSKSQEIPDSNVKVDQSTTTQSSAMTSYNDFQLVIDSGFNCTWIIPIIKGTVHYKAVKKCDIGGRFFTGLLKEMLSFRHYDVSEETILVNRIKEQCCYMSPQSYTESFRNKNDSVVEYVLPDFHSDNRGYRFDPATSLPLPQTAQTLVLTDELFAVPETIFHPEIAQLVNKPGIIETILECLSMVPEIVRPLLVGNIVLIGGNFNIVNFKERLSKELQVQCPIDWEVRVSCSAQPSTFTFESMCKFSETDEYIHARVTREEYYEKGADWLSKNRFTYQQSL